MLNSRFILSAFFLLIVTEAHASCEFNRFPDLAKLMALKAKIPAEFKEYDLQRKGIERKRTDERKDRNSPPVNIDLYGSTDNIAGNSFESAELRFSYDLNIPLQLLNRKLSKLLDLNYSRRLYNIDLEAAGKAGIMVVNAPNSSTQSVVELTIGHLISSLRHVARADRGLRNNLWEKKQLKGTELSGKCLGLIGFGRIAQGVASVAKAMGMEIHTYDPYLPPKVAKAQGAYLHKKVDSLFKTCTHISIHCNLSDETHHLVNSDRMKMMPGKKSGIVCGNHIVNCARGGIVDEDALLAALEDGTISSAALDVFEVEPLPENYSLLQHENFHGTPHIGAATKEAQQRVGIEIADAIITGLKGRTPSTIVNGKYL